PPQRVACLPLSTPAVPSPQGYLRHNAALLVDRNYPSSHIPSTRWPVELGVPVVRKRTCLATSLNCVLNMVIIESHKPNGADVPAGRQVPFAIVIRYCYVNKSVLVCQQGGRYLTDF